jgi:asparagine N-glycosylation enzyme membrane subunit Stt3
MTTKYLVSDFTDNEIGEIRLYIEKHVPYHILNKMYLLSGNVEDKITIFTGVYRIISSCRNYASTKELKDKLNYFLENSERTYKGSLPLITKYSFTQTNYGKMELINEMSKVIYKNFKVMDELIDVFIVLGEHIQLMRTDAVIGVSIKDKDEEIKRLVTKSREIVKKEGA